MAKGNADATDQRLKDTLAKANTQYDTFNTATGQRSNEAYGRQTQAYSDAMEGYKNMAAGTGQFAGLAGMGGGGGGYSAPQFRAPSYGNVTGTYNEFQNTGGIDAAAMRVADPTLQELMRTGGMSAADSSTIDRSIAGYENLAKTGGVDEAARARLRGNGVFDEFSQTGGLSTADRANIRSRATSTIPSFYGSLATEANRQRRIGGGSAAMGNAAAMQMARARSRDTAEAALNAELGITSAVNAGRQWGATGASTSEAGLQGLVTGNQLSALRGSGDLALGRSTQTGNIRLGAAGTLSASERAIQEDIQRGRMFGTEGNRAIDENLAAVANQQAAANASAANANTGAGERAREFDAEMRAQGIAGIAGLRGQTPGEDAFYSGQTLAGINAQTGANLQGIGLAYQSPNASGSRLSTGAGIAGNLLGSYLMGGGKSLLHMFGGGGPGGGGNDLSYEPGGANFVGPINQPGANGPNPYFNTPPVAGDYGNVGGGFGRGGGDGGPPRTGRSSIPGTVTAGPFGTQMYDPNDPRRYMYGG